MRTKKSKSPHRCPKGHLVVGDNLCWGTTRRTTSAGKRVYKSRRCKTCHNHNAMLAQRKARKTRKLPVRPPEVRDFLILKSALAAVDAATKNVSANETLVDWVTTQITYLSTLSKVISA